MNRRMSSAVPSRSACSYTRELGKAAATRLMAADYTGTGVRDGWVVYNSYEKATHQTCVAHLLRRCHKMAEDLPAWARSTPREVKGLLLEALDARDLDAEGRAEAVIDIGERFDMLLERPHPPAASAWRSASAGSSRWAPQVTVRRANDCVACGCRAGHHGLPASPKYVTGWEGWVYAFGRRQRRPALGVRDRLLRFRCAPGGGRDGLCNCYRHASLRHRRSDRRRAVAARKFGGIKDPPVLADGVLYVTSSDLALYAVAAATGAELWHFPGGEVDGDPGGEGPAPVIGETPIYVVLERTLHALDLS